MTKLTFAMCFILAFAAAGARLAQASDFDNENGIYVLDALPPAENEARRTDSMKLSDQQPAGLFVKNGDVLSITVANLPVGASLTAQIGFRPMWNVNQDQQSQDLRLGSNEVRINQSGPLFFRYTTKSGTGEPVHLTVDGGAGLPLYVDANMDAADWQVELKRFAAAPFVQLLGDKAMITLPRKTYRKHPIENPAATFAAIDKVIDLENDLAGFDGSSALNTASPLRHHYLEDFRASAKDRESYYMYATDEFIGLQADNVADLTDPEKLKTLWGIWHETGHVHQQNSWTWGPATEITVNIFSLYVQEKFGQPSRLLDREDGTTSTYQLARAYLKKPGQGYLKDDEDRLFVKLVMFDQLKQAYGWDIYRKLFQHFRAQPMPADASDQDKAEAFINTMCRLTRDDLRPFFKSWGFRLGAETNRILDGEELAIPEKDGSASFE